MCARTRLLKMDWWWEELNSISINAHQRRWWFDYFSCVFFLVFSCVFFGCSSLLFDAFLTSQTRARAPFVLNWIFNFEQWRLRRQSSTAASPAPAVWFICFKMFLCGCVFFSSFFPCRGDDGCVDFPFRSRTVCIWFFVCVCVPVLGWLSYAPF